MACRPSSLGLVCEGGGGGGIVEVEPAAVGLGLGLGIGGGPGLDAPPAAVGGACAGRGPAGAPAATAAAATATPSLVDEEGSLSEMDVRDGFNAVRGAAFSVPLAVLPPPPPPLPPTGGGMGFRFSEGGRGEPGPAPGAPPSTGTAPMMREIGRPERAAASTSCPE